MATGCLSTRSAPFMGKKYATVCDPWDAGLHIVPLEANQTFKYTGQPTPGVDFWGQRYNYDSASVGGRSSAMSFGGRRG